MSEITLEELKIRPKKTHKDPKSAIPSSARTLADIRNDFVLFNCSTRIINIDDIGKSIGHRVVRSMKTFEMRHLLQQLQIAPDTSRFLSVMLIEGIEFLFLNLELIVFFRPYRKGYRKSTYLT